MKLYNPFRQLSTRELVALELEQARRDKLEAETARDYAHAIVAYNEDRIARLENYAASHAHQDPRQL